MTQVRLSPSGPNIDNASGGPFTPGAGARLRLAEAMTTIAAGTFGVIPTAPAVLGPVVGVTASQAALLAPDKDLNYRVTVLCEVNNPSTNVPGEVQLYLETSVDGGTTWTEQASNTHIANSTEVAPAVPLVRQIRLDLTLKAGSALGVTSSPATASLLVRAKIGASSGGGVVTVVSAVTPGGDTKSVGSLYLALEECFEPVTATVQVRGGNSGPVLTGSPGNALIVAPDGQSVTTTPIAPGGGVTSWNLRLGAVVPVANDYKASQILNDSLTAPGAEVSDALDNLQALAFVAGTPQVGFVIGWDGTQKIWQAVPVAFAVTSFAKVGATLFLAGATVVNPSFTASYNQAATAVTLTDTAAHSDVIALPGTAFVSPHSFPLATYGASVTFTDTASSPLGSGARSVTLTAGNNVYFGSAVDPGGGGYTSAFANSLTATLKQAPAGTYAYNALAGQSCFFWVRSAFGLTPADFTVGGFPFACSIVASAVAVTNANGVTENYDLIRSDNTGLGPFNLVEA